LERAREGAAAAHPLVASKGLIARIALFGVAMLFPMGPRFGIGFGNLYLATLLTLIWIVAWGVFVFAGPRGGLVLGTNMQRAVFFYWAFLILEIVLFFSKLAEEQVYLLRGVQFLAYMALFITVSSLRLDAEVPKALARFSAVVLLVECIIAWSGRETQIHGFLAGTFDGEHNSFAAYVVLVISIAGAYAVIATKGIVRVGLILLVALGVASIAYSFSRSGYLAVVVCCLAFVHRVRGKKGLVLALGLLTIVLCIAAAIVPHEMRDRFGSILKAASGRELDISYSSRLLMWKDALEDLVRSGFLGVGIYSYYVLDNYFVRALAETGIAGFLLVVWATAAILLWLYRAADRETDLELKAIMIGLYTGTIGLLLVMNMAVDIFLVHRVMGIYWILLGTVVAATREPPMPRPLRRPT
jgi:O-antigen ligase